MSRLCPRSGSPEASDPRYSSPRRVSRYFCPSRSTSLRSRRLWSRLYRKCLTTDSCRTLEWPTTKSLPSRQQVAPAGVRLDLDGLA